MVLMSKGRFVHPKDPMVSERNVGVQEYMLTYIFYV